MGSLESPVGYFFADIEGSTERWEKAQGAMQLAVARFELLTDELFARHGGVVQDRAGDGVFAIFKSGNPLQCALEMQLSMQRTDWSSVGGLDLRIGVHAGEDVGGNDVDRAVANRGSRIMSSGWGGQIVVSSDAANSFATPEGAHLQDLGLCRFKGVKDALQLFSLVHPELRRAEFPPLRSMLFEGPTAEQMSGPMFGRQAEFGELLSKLSQRRFVTLVGLGGNGKTRLALKAGTEIAASMPVCFTSLEVIREVADYPAALASSLGLTLNAGRPVDQQIIDYLQDKQMLLVVDSAETVAGHAQLLGEIVANCPLVSILATSREPLGVRGEVLVRVDGLDLPTSGVSAALELFLHEARLKDPSFVVRHDQEAVFRRICELVDGSPLALRLTAQWTNILSLEQILARLVQSMELLTPADAADQRQSMRGVFEGSWRLLTPEQQIGLSRLSIFVKAFDATAAAKIARLDLSAFAALERKSLLVRAGQGRFSMHAMVREFARERLAAAGTEEEMVRGRHAAYYLDAVRAVMEGAQVAERGASVENLRQDYPEIRAAWFYAIESGAKELVRRTTESLCYFLYARSMMREAVETFSAQVGDSSLERHFASIRANFLVHQGDVETAGVLASSVLTAEDASTLARGHANHALGNLAHIRGDFDQADARYTAAFDIRDSVGDLRGCCYASSSLGALHLLFVRLETARHYIKRGYRLARQIGDSFGMMASHVYAGDLAAVENRLEAAQDNYEMGLRLEDTSPHSQFRAMIHRRLGTLFVLRGDPESALRHHQEGCDLSRELGDQRTVAHSFIEIGKDWRLLGNIDRARTNLLRGVRLSITLGLQSCLQRGLLELSQVALTRGDVGGAHRLVSVLEGADLGDLRADYEALLVQLAGGEAASFAPVTITDLLNELIAEADTDTLKL